ncbi:MAG: YlmC/YmxH family sporulation protein [Clostridia bacterium]|nr:YlmC/YmxH family sporulation protein [Clostridia bacterium]
MPRCTTLSQLREKEVINVCDGRRLGQVCDLEFDTDSGRITALMIGAPKGFFGWGKEETVVVPWQQIQRIGADIILVDAGEICPCRDDPPEKPKPPHRWFC